MKKYDEFDDPKGNDFLGSVGPKAAFFIVLIALSFMIGVAWKLYVGGGDKGSDAVPIVRVEAEPYKVEPKEAGGMEMPHKDSTIFSSLNSDRDEDDGIENLLADDNDEEPMPRSQLFAGLNTERNPDLHAEAQETPLDQPLTEDEERIVSQAKEAKAVVTNLVEEGANALVDGEAAVKEAKPEIIKVLEKVEPVVEVEKEVVKGSVKVEPAPIPAPEKAVTPAVTMGGDHYVQLASVRDATRANAEWGVLQKKYGSVLSGYSYRVETADLGAKGIYYRIQAGPVSKAQADETCKAIKRKTPGGCLVKKK